MKLTVITTADPTGWKRDEVLELVRATQANISHLPTNSPGEIFVGREIVADKELTTEMIGKIFPEKRITIRFEEEKSKTLPGWYHPLGI